jgi:hypothetical protein
MIFVGLLLIALRYELVTRYAEHGIQHTLIGDMAVTKLFRDHPLPRD